MMKSEKLDFGRDIFGKKNLDNIKVQQVLQHRVLPGALWTDT